LSQLKRDTDLRGKGRLMQSQDESARTSVRNAITRALNKFNNTKNLTNLHTYLRKTITTGFNCCYDPDKYPEIEVSWVLHPK
jgi:hypothetical protein